MNVAFSCPICETPAHARGISQARWTCPRCDHALEIGSDQPAERMQSCAICQNRELYRKKNFPHWLGLSILTVACILFLAGQAMYWKWLAWSVLLGSALLDGMLYLGVSDVRVCYRCGAHHTGVPIDISIPPFELETAERYRQERLRRLYLQSQKR